MQLFCCSFLSIFLRVLTGVPCRHEILEVLARVLRQRTLIGLFPIADAISSLATTYSFQLEIYLDTAAVFCMSRRNRWNESEMYWNVKSYFMFLNCGTRVIYAYAVFETASPSSVTSRASDANSRSVCCSAAVNVLSELAAKTPTRVRSPAQRFFLGSGVVDPMHSESRGGYSSARKIPAVKSSCNSFKIFVVQKCENFLAVY